MKIQSAALLLTACSGLLAQPIPVTFDAATIRPADPNARGVAIRTDPGILTMTNHSLMDCIMWAWNRQAARIQAPAWFNDTRFDVNARSTEPADEDRLRIMLQSLLAQRFGIRLHRESKELPAYDLTVAKGGPKFHEPTDNDISQFRQSTAQGEGHFGKGRGTLAATNVKIQQLADQLSDPLKRPVIDKTGLTGRYDIQIDVTAYKVPSETGDGERLDDAVSIIFGAFQQQLGLKLSPQKEAVDLLVIDAANKIPSEN